MSDLPAIDMMIADDLFDEIEKRHARGERTDKIYCTGGFFDRCAKQLAARVYEASDGYDHFMINVSKVGWVKVQRVP